MFELTKRIKKFNLDRFNEIITELDFDEQMTDLITLCETDIDIIEKLKNQGYLETAIKILLYGLPKREAIWWAYVSCRDFESKKNNSTTQLGLSTVQQWVKNPTEKSRRFAGEIGKQLEFYCATSWLCTAVFWSGGSIAPEGKPEALPATYMCYTAASNAITFVAHAIDDEKFLEQTLQRGLHIAMGGNGLVTTETD